MTYIAATVTESIQETDGRTRLRIIYTGNAGEPPVERLLYINQETAPSAHYIRGEAIAQLALLNENRTVMAAMAVPVVLDTTTALPAPSVAVQASYMAASLPFTPGATPQDIFSIIGSASKSVNIVAAGIVTVQTANGGNNWQIVKRSTANSGGTSAIVAPVPCDPAFPAASAVVRQYTANPTAGSLVGRVWSGRVPAPTPATAGIGNPNVQVVFSFPNLKLSGANDVLAWNFNGAALPAGLSVTAYFWWTEL